MSETVVGEQGRAVRALLAMTEHFPDLPSAELVVDQISDGGPSACGVVVHVHHAGAFERWRQALALDPAADPVVHDHPTFMAVRLRGHFAGVPVHLVGYLPNSQPAAPVAA